MNIFKAFKKSIRPLKFSDYTTLNALELQRSYNSESRHYTQTYARFNYVKYMQYLEFCGKEINQETRNKLSALDLKISHGQSVDIYKEMDKITENL